MIGSMETGMIFTYVEILLISGSETRKSTGSNSTYVDFFHVCRITTDLRFGNQKEYWSDLYLRGFFHVCRNTTETLFENQNSESDYSVGIVHT